MPGISFGRLDDEVRLGVAQARVGRHLLRLGFGTGAVRYLEQVDLRAGAAVLQERFLGACSVFGIDLLYRGGGIGVELHDDLALDEVALGFLGVRRDGPE